MSVKERILEFAKACHHNKTTIAASMGVNESTLRKAKSTSVDNVAMLLDAFPELSADWLLRGKGSMFADKDSKSSTIIGEDAAVYEHLIAGKNKRIEELERELARLKASILTDNKQV